MQVNDSPAVVRRCAELIEERTVAVLSGAGVSTPSGIPDYRGDDGTLRRRAPIQYREFIGEEAARRRYWARSLVGWAWLRNREPNDAHRAVARLEDAGRVTAVVTQNVDGLHQAAGSREVIDLHGRLSRVVCLECGAIETRDELQQRMLLQNPGWERLVAEMAPDGDAELDEETIAGFRIAACRRCRGVLKPDVIFFGENVPASRVSNALDLVLGADLLLVLGSSLTVFSGFRFVLAASERGIPIIIVNRGATRGDKHAELTVNERVERFLPKLVGSVSKIMDGREPRKEQNQ